MAEDLDNLKKQTIGLSREYLKITLPELLEQTGTNHRILEPEIFRL
jgi:hypothetical protein